MEKSEQRERVIQFDTELQQLAEELLRGVSEEIIRVYYGEYTVVELIRNSLKE